jgi:hypothetical protein
MNLKRVILTAIFLGAALIAPMAITANAAAPQVISVRVYDRTHRDYHNWDDREERSYQTFRVEHPRYHVIYRKATRRQQDEYWRWRHAHHDHD